MSTLLETLENELTDIINDLRHAQNLLSDGRWGQAESLIEACEESLSLVRKDIAKDRGRS